MKHISLLLFSLLIKIDASSIRVKEDFYTAAVVEYESLNSYELESPMEVMIFNVNEYISFIQDASKLGVDIIVFPEYGITGVDLSTEKDRARAKQFMVTGDQGNVYCDNDEQPILSLLSCTARYLKVVVEISIKAEKVDVPFTKLLFFDPF